MDGFCASAPQQRGQHNPNVDYVPFEQMKGRILKIVDDFHGWVEASTSMDYKALESVAHICIFWIAFQNSIHYPASLRTPHRPEAKLHGNWQVSLGPGEGEGLLLCRCSVFFLQHTGMFRDCCHFSAECDGGQLHLLHIWVRTFKIYHFYWAVFEPFKDSLQWFTPSHMQNPLNSQTLCVSCSFKGKIGPPV